VAVAAHWFDLQGDVVTWDGPRTSPGEEVAPGDVTTVDAVLEAPPSPGLFRMQWDMVDEGVCWFSETDPASTLARWVLVVPRLPWFAIGWLAIVLVVAVTVRSWGPRWPTVAGVLDVLWFFGSMTVIERIVLEAAGQPPALSGTLVAWVAFAVLVAPCLLAPPRHRPWIVWGLAATLTTVLWADLLHVRFFGDLLNLAVLRSAGQLGQIEASVVDLGRWSDLWMVVNLGLGLVVVRSAARAGSGRLHAVRVVVAAAVAATIPALLLVADPGGVLEQRFRTAILAREVGVVGTHVMDVGRQLNRTVFGHRLEPARRHALEEMVRATAATRAGVGPFFGVARGRNLLMIQVESLQDFVVGFEVEGQEVTPFLNRWAENGLRFTEVTDQTAQGRSSDAELATQVSLLPPESGAAAFLYPGDHFTGLAGVLAEHGYHTVSAVAFDGSFWNRAVMHRDFGYQHSLFVDDFAPGPVVGWGLNDRDFLNQMASRLEHLPRPFCAWLITLSLHHPFDGFPDRLKELDLAGLEGTDVGNYLHTMHLLDAAVESLAADLDRSGLLEDTVIAIWGDHDAGFDWTSQIAAAMGQPHTAAGWYRSQRIPLLVRVPEVPDLVGRRDLPAGHTDVAPTLLALLGVDPGGYAFVGRNLLGQPGDGPVVGEYGCWSTRDLLYLRGGPELADGRCLDRRSLTPRPVAECAAADIAAVRQQDFSRDVLEHDLQRGLAAGLDVTR
jgi:phosphoglycerol transferase MdoB-like AlkP superfamily enzyme